MVTITVPLSRQDDSPHRNTFQARLFMTEQDPMTRAPSAWDEFLTGVKEESPLLLGVVPFGMIYGVLGVEAGLDPLVVFFMSFCPAR